MQDILSMPKQLHRPRLLVRAARLGAQEYNRDRHLKRLLGYHTLPRASSVLIQLIEAERILDDQRRSDDAGYSLPKHIDFLIAIMGEARLMSCSRSDASQE